MKVYSKYSVVTRLPLNKNGKIKKMRTSNTMARAIIPEQGTQKTNKMRCLVGCVPPRPPRKRKVGESKEGLRVLTQK